MRILSLILVALLGSQLTACGGSSDSSGSTLNNSAAVLSTDNAEDISSGISATVLNAIMDKDAQGRVPQTNSAQSPNTLPQVRSVLQATSKVVSSSIDLELCDTGSAVFSGSETNMLLTFTNCNVGGVVTTGKVRYEVSNNGDSVKMTYENFSIVYGDITQSMDGLTFSCTGMNSAQPVCNFDSQYIISGQTYRTEKLSVTGSGDGYEVNGRIYAGEFGYVEVETTSALIIGEDGTIIAGTLEISDESGNTLTITFDGADVTLCFVTSGSEVCEALDAEAPAQGM
ncbi:MAG: hypothetical protein H7A09_09960 [Oceanospirillaceae bacterium]|nr:hypothetical protein [Oceanospirillaceae bacterium]MCP5335137.1 hypothetical protein [Oceanospirillaceae bacterium]